ncbi:endonuclease/exonuclease/phosphatase family protein [Empedobacter stercoris]|uniref:endonuclease/exonuclease/phosphatase family protein n=1 Tax=Empedobacter stercoris TaxID=1628248 RepID=UPI001CE0A86A|nr:endonuclease/exonuclease/phosphatase family protein [Empedobacter stercoris]MCA4783209.1 endonuclease/exonuclease/phosphatase family protein [Empedobacter stercoris]
MSVISKFKLNYFNRLVLTINIVFLLVAYCVYLNKVFTPSEIPYFNFISIGFPILFAFGTIFLAYWLLFSWRHFLLILILSAGLFYPIYLSYPIVQFNKIEAKKADLTVLTYNAHGFKDEGTKELLIKNKADIMLLQEAREAQQKSLKNNEFKDYYSEFYGLLTIYSKYPIIQTKIIETENSEDFNGLAAYADIDLGTDTIRVINVYLEPMYIDKTMVKDIIQSEDSKTAEISSRKVELKLVKGMQKHQKQLEAIIPYIKSSRHPVILGTDLNATPISYEYEKLKNYLHDSFIAVGKGDATTFHGFKFPIRIDYLFHSKEFTAIEANVIRKKFSDHYPVVVKYKFAE